MARMSQFEVDAHQAKFAPKVAATSDQIEGAVAREASLHKAIIRFCNEQWPRWKPVHARMDKKATLPVGCQDFTIFADKGRVFAIECKARNEKPDADQLAWHKEMEMLGTKVHVIRCMDDFKKIVCAQ